jgi:two-component system, OmpR family, sensor kinase
MGSNRARPAKRQGRQRQPRTGAVASGPPTPSASALAPPCASNCLASVAHLLSQPLTALRGSLELALLSESEPAELRLAVQEGLERAEEMVRLVALLRELADAESGGAEKELLGLGELAAEVVEDLRLLAESREIRLELNRAEEVQLWAPPARLRQAFLKLLYLAIQHGPRGGTVQIELRRTGKYRGVEIRSHQEAPALPPCGPPTTFRPVLPSWDAIKESSGLAWLIATRLIYRMGGTVLSDGPPAAASH